MALHLHNTLGNRIEEFQPQQEGVVTLYTCGPTVYNYPHIGNYRYFVFVDVLRRALKFLGYEVRHAMNITDVDDKIIRDAGNEDIETFTGRYIEGFFADLDRLNIERAEYYPKATDHIDDIASAVERLREGGHAYEKDGSWYFRIASFPGYGKLSNLDRREIQDGARVESDEYEKDNVRDFALWKEAKANEAVHWDTPIGAGRPGWHIECSVMAMKYLGDTLDIHAGGEDLIFPHHENEIAQSEAMTGKPFARYWLHPRHLLVNGEKMSKSKGNFFLIQDLIDKGHKPLAIRYTLLASHYRNPLNFTEEAAQASANALERLRDFRVRMSSGLPAGETVGEETRRVIDEALARFRERLEDDLDLPGALAAVFDLVRAGNSLIDREKVTAADGAAFVEFLETVDRVLGVLEPAGEESLEEEVERLIQERQEARKARDFARADAIRDDLAARGIILEDTKDGVRWKVKG